MHTTNRKKKNMKKSLHIEKISHNDFLRILDLLNNTPISITSTQVAEETKDVTITIYSPETISETIGKVIIFIDFKGYNYAYTTIE